MSPLDRCSDVPVFRVTVAPVGTDGQHFAMSVVMSHAVADGFTYYAVYSMLDLNAKPIRLNPTRKMGVRDDVAGAVGRKKFRWLSGPSLCLGSILQMFRRARPPMCR